jgi:polynucleotide 5'-hydroxyl-kinase GRC3/NOL9
MDVPGDWQKLNVESWTGVVMCVGDADTGKTTFLRYAYERLREAGRRVAVLDGDPGQSTLGLPATMTCTLSRRAPDERGETGEASFPPEGPSWSVFVGATSPRGHMLEIVVGARRLFDAAATAGAEVVLYDTTGLVAVRPGGRALKHALFDLLRPGTVLALQRSDELEPILASVRRSNRHTVAEPSVSDAVTRRSTEDRKAHRAHRFESVFAPAGIRTVDWTALAVRPNLDVRDDHLVALEDRDGYVEALARVASVDRSTCHLDLHTPHDAPASADTLRLGDVALDPETYRDRSLREG